MPRKLYKTVISLKGDVLNGKRYRDANTGIWYSVDKYGNRIALDLDKQGRQIKSKYIGGTRDETRKAYWNQAPIMRHATDSIAKEYGISGDLLRNRLNAEGFTDDAINEQNGYVKMFGNRAGRVESNYIKLNQYRDPDDKSGVGLFGFDDVGTLINSGNVKLKNERFYTGDFTNEHGRNTLAAQPDSNKDGIGIMAATLKYYQDLAKQRNLKNTSLQNSILANMYYNRGQNSNYKKIDDYDYTKRQTKKYGGPIIHLEEL